MPNNIRVQGFLGNAAQPVPLVAGSVKLLLALLASILFACRATGSDDKHPNQALDRNDTRSSLFVPIHPVPAIGKVDVVRNGGVVSVDVRLLEREELQRMLSTTDSSVVVAKIDKSGSLGYLTGAVTQEQGSYRVVMDFSNYTTIATNDNGAPALGWAKVGVGLRLTADIVTRTTGVDLGSILKIGLAASRNELSGRLQVQAIGIASPKIISLLPGMIPAVNESAILAALEAMAAVKAKMFDSDTAITPHVLAIRGAILGESLKPTVALMLPQSTGIRIAPAEAIPTGIAGYRIKFSNPGNSPFRMRVTLSRQGIEIWSVERPWEAAASTNESDQVPLPPLEAGTYSLRVEGQNGGSSGIQLWVERLGMHLGATSEIVGFDGAIPARAPSFAHVFPLEVAP